MILLLMILVTSTTGMFAMTVGPAAVPYIPANAVFSVFSGQIIRLGNLTFQASDLPVNAHRPWPQAFAMLYGR